MLYGARHCWQRAAVVLGLAALVVAWPAPARGAVTVTTDHSPVLVGESFDLTIRGVSFQATDRLHLVGPARDVFGAKMKLTTAGQVATAKFSRVPATKEAIGKHAFEVRSAAGVVRASGTFEVVGRTPRIRGTATALQLGEAVEVVLEGKNLSNVSKVEFVSGLAFSPPPQIEVVGDTRVRFTSTVSAPNRPGRVTAKIKVTCRSGCTTVESVIAVDVAKEVFRTSVLKRNNHTRPRLWFTDGAVANDVYLQHSRLPATDDKLELRCPFLKQPVQLLGLSQQEIVPVVVPADADSGPAWCEIVRGRDGERVGAFAVDVIGPPRVRKVIASPMVANAERTEIKLFGENLHYSATDGSGNTVVSVVPTLELAGRTTGACFQSAGARYGLSEMTLIYDRVKPGSGSTGCALVPPGKYPVRVNYWYLLDGATKKRSGVVPNGGAVGTLEVVAPTPTAVDWSGLATCSSGNESHKYGACRSVDVSSGDDFVVHLNESKSLTQVQGAQHVIVEISVFDDTGEAKPELGRKIKQVVLPGRQASINVTKELVELPPWSSIKVKISHDAEHHAGYRPNPAYFTARLHGTGWDAITLTYSAPPGLVVIGEEQQILKLNAGVGLGYTIRTGFRGPRFTGSLFGMITNLVATDEEENAGFESGDPAVLFLVEAYLRESGAARYIPLQLGLMLHFGKKGGDGDDADKEKVHPLLVLGLGLNLSAGG